MTLSPHGFAQRNTAMKRKNAHGILLIFALWVALAACQPAGQDDEEVVATEAMEEGEEVQPVVSEEVVVETEEVVVETEEAQIVDTPTPEPLDLSNIVLDERGDCATPVGEPVDCGGEDIVKAIVARIENDEDLLTFMAEAGDSGFDLPEIIMTFDFPVFIVGIEFDNFDPNFGFTCVNWANQPAQTPPDEPDATVLATCVNPIHEFIYVNTISLSGEPGVEADPEGTEVITDPDRGIVFIQAGSRVYNAEPADRLGIISVANDNSQHDQAGLEIDEGFFGQ